jgi:hypothetical protein
MENRKNNFSPSRPIRPSPPRACVCAPSVPGRRVPPVGANLHTLSPSLSCSVGSPCRRRFFSACVRSFSLPHGPHPSVPSASQPLAHVPPPWTRPRPRVLRPPLHALASLDPVPRSPTTPTHLRPQPSSLAPSLALCMRPAELRRRSPGTAAVLRLFLRPRHDRCPGEFCLTDSSSGHPSVRPQPLWFARSTLTGVFPMQPESAAVDLGLHRLLAVLQRSWVCACGKQPPRASISRSLP